ncbi:DUF2269 family protein [Fredinandcohnia sp. QZ13]|uniref:DUF2269 family protein n=1 Tax=Fredinandcohnia sp. QZ13 TaxID=3073144 RepID=UPI0028534ADD|nr:DUF2269 family protein [Fredinandcohnia sp. QZ13]MDR4887107.1 DUF2269 family protein [Fredinandcohnia sp. QZ13]
MKFLILVHVLSAIIGVGPTFFAHVLLRKNQNAVQLRQSMALSQTLNFFPKIGGSIAVLTGILLVIIGNYGSFLNLWLIGSLIIYILIQIVVIGIIDPNAKKLAGWVFDENNKEAVDLPKEQSQLLSKISNQFYFATAFGVLLFILMIWKPL